jgi:hypothetical protein
MVVPVLTSAHPNDTFRIPTERMQRMGNAAAVAKFPKQRQTLLEVRFYFANIPEVARRQQGFRPQRRRYRTGQRQRCLPPAVAFARTPAVQPKLGQRGHQA